MGQMNRVCRNNTSVAATGKTTRVTLHGTTVVEFTPDSITLRTGGYDTVTTRARMNQAASEYGLDYRVYRAKGVTYVRTRDGETPLGNRIALKR